MDSLFTNYASSDDEDEQPAGETLENSIPPSKSAPSSLPKPFSCSNEDQSESTTSIFGSSSLFTSLPLPKASSFLFTSLPPPKTPKPSSSLDRAPRKVIQFRPLFNAQFDDDDDDDVRESKIPRKKEAYSGSKGSSLSNLRALLPPPKQSLGPSSFSRKSIIETEQSEDRFEESAASNADVPLQDSYTEDGLENPYWGYGGDAGGINGDLMQYQENHGEYGNQQYWDASGGYANWADGPSFDTDQTQSFVESVSGMDRKRGRNEIPAKVIEVKQDQLISNRPRQDQVKLTGIAFGPSHQPVSSGLKPSKMHRRKHQIQSLYYDMKQKEMELAERRARGLLTKAQTQAKYGW